MIPPAATTSAASPDGNAAGFLDKPPAASRYENASTDPGNVAAKIAAFIPKGASVLDVGCGTGSITEVIEKMTGAYVIGIEPDVERAEAARLRGVKAFQGYLSEAFLKEHGPFQIIMFADVLEHLPNPSEVVMLAREGLIPGGSIVASVPNVAHWSVRQELLTGNFDYQPVGIMDATHLRWFTRRSLHSFFERLGFQVVGYSTTVNIDLPAYTLRRPWKWFSGPTRRKIVGRLVEQCPTLFGVQHVIKAKA